MMAMTERRERDLLAMFLPLTSAVGSYSASGQPSVQHPPDHPLPPHPEEDALNPGLSELPPGEEHPAGDVRLPACPHSAYLI